MAQAVTPSTRTRPCLFQVLGEIGKDCGLPSAEQDKKNVDTGCKAQKELHVGWDAVGMELEG